jgi:hypothetical protein
MSSFVGIVVLILCSGGVIMTGIVWGGPWPPKASVTNGLSQEINLGNMRIWTAIFFLGTIVALWLVNPFHSLLVSYLVLLFLPLLVGVVIRRILLLREKRA